MNRFPRYLALLFLIFAAPAANAEGYNGTELYMANCSNCHGVYGEGDGIVTPSLALVLQDLRYISDRNNGEFPRQIIAEIIDGRELRLAHGPDGMPVWGNAFSRSEGYSEAAQLRVQHKIQALVDFVESIQIADD
jgi:mono/diheme cytochrome c family protein